MISLNTYRIIGQIPFEYYLLSDVLVKKLNREFEFYGVRFYREERTTELTVCIDYPKGNVYWYVDFKRFVTTEILSRDARYEVEWNKLLSKLKDCIAKEFKAFNDTLSNVDPKSVLDSMYKYDLRIYQAFDLEQLVLKMNQDGEHSAGLILSEQRTGKTRVALACCNKIMPKGSTAVIICPKAAVVAWKTELEIMNAYMKDTVFVYNAISKISMLSKLDAYRPNAINVNIMTYDLFKRLTYAQQRRLVYIKESRDVMFIGDEAHRLRNFKTLQSETIFNFKEGCLKDKINLRILGVTGTPAVKESSDVFGILSLINFSKMGFSPFWKDFNQFKEYFYNCEDTSYGKVCKTLKRKQELEFLIQANSIQTKQRDLELFKDYNKKYLKYVLEMTPNQRTIYNAVSEKMAYEDKIDCKNSLVQLMRLQQICLDPSGLVASFDDLAPKLKWILDFIKKNPIPMIVMGKKVAPLEHLAELLGKNSISYAYIHGSVNLADRSEEIDKFKSGKACIFIIQLDVGRESLTLPEAKCTIFLDRDFSQGYNEQAEARMTPIDGKPCIKYVIDIVMKDTVEENIYDTLVTRKESIDNVNTVFKTRKEVLV